MMPANKLLSYPHDVFLMVRLEFVQICEDELEAKILRIIERYVDEERTRLFQETVNKTGAKPEQVMNVTKDVWVPISYRLFMSDLFGTVTSENTIKKAIKNLLDKKIIFRRFDKKNRYDAPEYRIHISVLQMLLEVVGKSGYQNLIPSIVDTLKNSYPHDMTPSECQELILSSTLRVSNFDTNYNNSNGNNTNNNKDVSASAERPPASTESDLSTKSHIATTDTQTTLLQAEHERETHNGHGSIRHHGAGDTGDRSTLVPLVSADGSSSATGTQAAKQVELSPANVEKPAKPKKPVKQDENALPPDVEDVIENYKKLFNHPIPISDAIVKAAKVLAPCHPTAEKLSEARKWIRDHDEKGYYKKRGGVKLFDIVREWEAWEDAIAQQSQRTQRMNGNAENKHPQLGLMPRQNPSNEVLRKEAF